MAGERLLDATDEVRLADPTFTACRKQALLAVAAFHLTEELLHRTARFGVAERAVEARGDLPSRCELGSLPPPAVRRLGPVDRDVMLSPPLTSIATPDRKESGLVLLEEGLLDHDSMLPPQRGGW